MQLRLQVRTILRAHVKPRMTKTQKRDKTKKIPAYLVNPYTYIKDLLGEEKSGKLENSHDEVEQCLRETHSNPFLEDPLGNCVYYQLIPQKIPNI